MNRRLREAYYDYLDELAGAGIIDHALDNAILEGKTVEEHMIEALRAAGRLPEGWAREARQRSAIEDRVPMPPQVKWTNGRRFWRLMTDRRVVAGGMPRPTVIIEGAYPWAELVRPSAVH